MRDIHIAPTTLKIANDFVRSYHRHSNPTTGCKFAICLLDADGVLHGVAICGRPLSRFYDNGFTLEILRVCTDGYKNGCSMLYGACCRIAKEMGYKKVITYTLDSESGASLKASNFSCEGEAGGTHWTGKRDRRDQGVHLPNQKKNRWTREVRR